MNRPRASLHAMYVDKPMRGHGLMQVIARVNRVFGSKPGGLLATGDEASLHSMMGTDVLHFDGS